MVQLEPDVSYEMQKHTILSAIECFLNGTKLSRTCRLYYITILWVLQSDLTLTSDLTPANKPKAFLEEGG